MVAIMIIANVLIFMVLNRYVDMDIEKDEEIAMVVILIIAGILFIIGFCHYIDMDLEQKGVTLGTAIKDIILHLKQWFLSIVR